MARIPVSEGEELEVKIQSVGGKGDGLARVEGFVLFVPETKVGDHVRVRIKRLSEKAAWAEVVGKVEAPVDENQKLVNSLKEEDFSEEF